MKKLLIVPVVLGLASLSAVPASAGCITGAIVGGIAGHMVGHGGVGAAAGCAYGVHRSHEQRRMNDMDSGRSSAHDDGRYNNNR